METLLLLGVIQGAITGTGLLLHAGRSNGSHWLALGMLALSLTLLRLWTHAAGLEADPLFRRLPLSFDLAIFPLFHLYALSLTAASPSSIRRAWLWLLPWAVFMGYSVLVYLAGFGEASLQRLDALADQWQYAWVKRIEDYLTIVLNTVLAGLIWARIRRYHARISNWVPQRFADLLLLLKRWMALALVTAVVNLLAFAAHHGFGFHDRSVVSQAAQIFYVVAVYAVGLIGFKLRELPQFPDPAPATALPDSRSDDAYARLQTLMQSERLWTEPDLNLNDLSQRLGMTAVETSRVIKHGSGGHFRNYVNAFRIDAVRRKLRDPAYRSVSVLAIALESGFNSESSFYRVFKAATGLSPTEFRQQG